MCSFRVQGFAARTPGKEDEALNPSTEGFLSGFTQLGFEVTREKKV